jgi:hypothetical protein
LLRSSRVAKKAVKAATLSLEQVKEKEMDEAILQLLEKEIEKATLQLLEKDMEEATLQLLEGEIQEMILQRRILPAQVRMFSKGEEGNDNENDNAVVGGKQYKEIKLTAKVAEEPVPVTAATTRDVYAANSHPKDQHH